MVCIPGKIRTSLTDEVYNCCRVGYETRRDRAKRRVQCDICDAELAEASLSSHLATQHDVYRSKVICQDLLIERPAATYSAIPAGLGKFYCPVPGCEGTGSTKWNLWKHFQARHWQDFVSIPGEGVYPKFPLRPKTAIIGRVSTPSTFGSRNNSSS